MNSQIFQYDGNPITFQIGEATMVNATQMAKPFGKQPSDWTRLKQTEEFLSSLSTVRGIPRTRFIQIRQGGQNRDSQGTWMHEDVALEFARWLSPQFAIWCNDRIKELLKYGMTATPQTIESILADPSNAIKLLTALKEERRKVAHLTDANKCCESENSRLRNLHHKDLRAIARQQIVIESQTPKVEYADNILFSESTYTTTQIAKELGMSGQRLNRELFARSIQFKQSGQWMLYSKYQAKGYVKTRTYTCLRSDGRTGTMISTVWTEAGRKFIHELLNK